MPTRQVHGVATFRTRFLSGLTMKPSSACSASCACAWSAKRTKPHPLHVKQVQHVELQQLLSTSEGSWDNACAVAHVPSS